MEYQGQSIVARLRERKRLVLYLLSFVVVIVIQAHLYWWGMDTFEGESRTILESIGVVVQSLTTTGYGQDAPWDSLFMSLLVIVMQFTGVIYLFIAFPLFIVPWIRETVAGSRTPRAIEGVEDHVVLCGYLPLYETFVQDLEANDREYVILESDDDLAEDLHEDGRNVVLGSPSNRQTLYDVNVQNARAVVVDAREDRGVETVLEIREVEPEVDIVALVDQPEQSQYLRYAGATTVLSPKHRLGKALADKAQNVLDVDLEASDVDESTVNVAEFHVDEASRIHGRPLNDVEAIEETGAAVVGAWIGGQFAASTTSDHHVDQNTVLVVAGTERQLKRVSRVTQSEGHVPPEGPVIVVGHGITGTTAEGILRKGGHDTTVVDADPDSGVDVVGDATEPETYQEAGIDEAATVVIALPDDETAMLATLVAREYGGDVELIVRATNVESVTKLYSAGADYVLALPRLASRMLLLELFERTVVTLPEEIRLTDTDAPELAGAHPRADEIEEETGAVVVGVRRDGEFITDFDEAFELQVEDQLVVGGPDDALAEFQETYSE